MKAVAAGGLERYRAAAGAVFLAKADAELSDRDLETLPEIKAEFAANAAETLAAEIERVLRLVPTAVEFLPTQGTFHAVFHVRTGTTDLYARTSIPLLPWPAVDFVVEEWASRMLPSRGVPTPVVRHVDLSRARLPFDLEIVEAAAGEPLSPGPGESRAVRALGATVARLHSVPCRGYGPLDPASLDSPSPEAIAPPAGLHREWKDYILLRLDEHLAMCRDSGALGGREVDAVQRAFARAEPLLATSPSALLHGDLGNPNVLVEGGRITAVLDWEDTLAGDPVFDIAAWGTFVGNHQRREAFLEGYREAAPQGAGLPQDFELRYGLYYLRIMLAKTVHRSRFGYSRTDRIPAAARLRPALEMLRELHAEGA